MKYLHGVLALCLVRGRAVVVVVVVVECGNVVAVCLVVEGIYSCWRCRCCCCRFLLFFSVAVLLQQ